MFLSYTTFDKNSFTKADQSAPPVRRITVNMLEVKVLNKKGLANQLAPSHALAGVTL